MHEAESLGLVVCSLCGYPKRRHFMSNCSNYNPTVSPHVSDKIKKILNERKEKIAKHMSFTKSKKKG